MVAIANSNDWDRVIAQATQRTIQKSSVTTKGAGNLHSFWRVAGTPAQGSIPALSAGALCDKNTSGAIPIPNRTGNCYLTKHGISCSVLATNRIVDRLWANGGHSGIDIVQATYSSPALTRNVGGIGNLIFVEIYAPTGSTATTLNVDYLNDTGVARTTSVVFPATTVAGQMIPVPLLDPSDLGVTAIKGHKLAATTGTAGSFGITLLQPIFAMPTASANIAPPGDAYSIGMPEISPNACLMLMQDAAGTSSGNLFGDIFIGFNP